MCISKTLTQPTLKDWVKAYLSQQYFMSINEEHVYQISSKSIHQYRVSCQSDKVFAPSYLRFWMSIYLTPKGFYFASEEHVYQILSNSLNRIKVHINRPFAECNSTTLSHPKLSD
ncbi:hypothetical protein AVEN_40284-1 [Araneus ventricosus]|uniref:Uncharacterized protein n=1 Tax=Araneus ventricosus TaxID=182803 RepID=A0A4Y2FAR5_ARAVE|nr:hypothetical protein AVEN_40284-1 [Araneus ventricosus]